MPAGHPAPISPGDLLNNLLNKKLSGPGSLHGLAKPYYTTTKYRNNNMKKTALLAATLGCMIQAQAQIGKPATENKKLKEHRAMVQQLLKNQFGGGTAQKPTGTQHRVIAQVMQELGGPVDSMSFKYSGTKGSNYNYDNGDFLYPQSFETWYAPRPMLPTLISNPLDLLADTISFYDGNTVTDMETATYRSDNKITNSTSISIDPSADDYYFRIANVYNTQGHIVKAYNVESMNNGVNYDTLSLITTTYNGTFTQAVVDTVFNKTAGGYEPVNLFKYYYNASNKIDSIVIADITLVPMQKFSFKYYPDGKLQQLINTSDDVTAVDSFGYTTGIAYATLWDSKVAITFEGETNVFGTRTLKYPGTSGLPDSARLYDYDETGNTWELFQTAKYSYTSFNEPQQIEFREDGDVLGHFRFYYESYDDGVSSIKSIAEHKEFNIYPNPFRNNMSIDWKGKAQSDVSIRLVNILGQEVYSTSLQLNTGSNTLQLPALNSGNYILVIRDAEGKSWSSKVVKQ